VWGEDSVGKLQGSHIGSESVMKKTAVQESTISEKREKAEMSLLPRRQEGEGLEVVFCNEPGLCKKSRFTQQ
jgi:hypothetical protein